MGLATFATHRNINALRYGRNGICIRDPFLVIPQNVLHPSTERSGPLARKLIEHACIPLILKPADVVPLWCGPRRAVRSKMSLRFISSRRRKRTSSSSPKTSANGCTTHFTSISPPRYVAGHSAAKLRGGSLTSCGVPQVPRPLLEQLAKLTLETDSVRLVSKIYDHCSNFVSLESTCFSLNIANSYAAMHSPTIKVGRHCRAVRYYSHHTRSDSCVLQLAGLRHRSIHQ